MDLTIHDLRKRIDVTLLEDRKRRWMSDSQNSLREFYTTDVIPTSDSLSMNLKELQQELIDEKNEMLRNELEKSSSDSKDIQANLLKRIKILENDFKRSQATLILNSNYNIKKSKWLATSLGSQDCVESSNSVRRLKSKDTKSKDRLLKNANDKRPSTHVRKMSSSVNIDSNKRETMHSNFYGSP
ncbi:hypothetical protein Tco_0436317 [Tanacetum coccineum]